MQPVWSRRVADPRNSRGKTKNVQQRINYRKINVPGRRNGSIHDQRTGTDECGKPD